MSKNSIQLPAEVSYNAQLPAEFGGTLLLAIIQQTVASDKLAEMTGQLDNSKSFLGFETARAILDLSEKDDTLNIDAIFDGAKEVERLNTRLMCAMGILSREISKDGTEVLLLWTDKNVEKHYAYGAELKEKDAAEHKRRFDNRKRLNIRLSDGCKAAITLRDGKTKAADMVMEENDEGVVQAVIKNAPVEIAGESPNGKVVFGNRTVQTGAQASPTLSSLVKLATTKHKLANEENSDRSDKGGDRSGDAKMGISDEDFGKAANLFIRMVNAQEKKFSKDQVKFMRSVQAILNKNLS